MKIKYWIGIVFLSAISFFLTRDFSFHDKSESIFTHSEKENAQEAKASPPIELNACRQHAGTQVDVNTLDEKELRWYINHCAYILLANENFSALDSTIAYLRQNKVRTPSGLWLQSFFYVGVEGYIDNAKTEIYFNQIDESLRHWIETSADPSTAHLVMSKLMIHKAWFYRGDGYASSVTEAKFKLFHDQISITKKYLLEHENISKNDPEWFTQMLMITRVEENSSEKIHKEYFNKAIKRYPDYYPIYFSASVYYLPKWGGSEEAFDSFSRYATSRLEETQASSVYARIYWAEICGLCGDQDLANWREHWTDIKAGFDEVIKEYPDQWNINNFARIACTARDYETTRLLMKKIKGKPIPDAWTREISYQYCADKSGFTNEGKNVN